MPSQEESQEEIKKGVEQWKWSEMQGLELVSENPTPNSNQNQNFDPLSEEEEEAAAQQKRLPMDGEGQNGNNNNNDGGEKEKKKETSAPAVGFGELFRFADGLDYVLMGIGTIGAFVHGCSLPIFLRFFADLVNSFGANANNIDKMTQEVLKYAFYFLVVGAAIWASSWAEISCWMYTGERQSTKMRIKYLEAALSQDIQFFDTEVRTSDVVFAINTDAVMVQDAISEKLGNFIHYMATFVSGFVVGFTAVWQLALVTLAVVPLIAVIGGIHTTTLAKLSSKSQDALSQAGNIAEQTIVQIRTVLAYVGESRALQAYSSALKISQKLGYKTGFSKGFGLGATYFTVFCCYALLLWYGGYLVRNNHTNGGLAIATMFSVMIGGLALGQSAPSMSAFAKARVAAAKIFQIIDHKPSVDKNGETGIELDSVSGLVELKDVNFSYPSRPDVKILNNFSLSVPAGKTIALVGSSGSGKSTVVSLIERFYDPTSGQVMLDGHDIKGLKLKWLRQQIGLVSQEPALFATTIQENILLGRPDASTVEIEEAARVSNAHSFIIKLPDAYDTQVGERGLQLSGGQKQRIAIARAMLKNPAILLLDEATSALDSESEKLVQEALDRFMIGRTTLVIAHRLSTIRKADLVAVLQQGGVLEMGTHDELFAKGENGVYAKLIKMQEIAHETAMSNARKSSARPSSARNSVSSPIITRNSSYGRSPYSRRLSDFSTSDFSLSVEGNYPSYRHEKLPFKVQASSFWRLAKMNSPEWTYALIGSVGSVICGSLSAFFAYVLSAVLSVYYNPDDAYMIREIGKYCYLLIGVSSAALIFNTLQHYFWDVVGENLTKRVREKMLAAVLKNEMAWFDQEENESSRIAARLSLDANNVRSAIGDRISVIMQNSALMLVACTAGFVLQWRLALVLVAVFPLVVAATVLQKMFMQGFSGDLEGAHAKATQLAGEAVANMRTVAAFNSEDKIVNLFTISLEKPLRKCFWKGQIAGSGFGIAQFLLYASYALGLWYASWLVKHGISDFSKTIRVFMVLMVSANGAAETLTLAPDFIKGGRAMKSVFDLLDRKTEIEPDEIDSIPVPDRLRGEVELKHVDFSYPTRPDVPVFRDLCLRARAGKTLALVGPSGCGKSSVVALIQRFYEPSSGRVMIDGKDIRKYNLKSLRRHIATVPQEPCLFATTIYDNIAYGHESATEADIIEAATLANAHKFISALPDGYKTFVGERGVQLSGGQKQRVAIARAFLRKAEIMLLDEATSALDAESEKCIQEAIERVCSGKTTIVVAHRLSTIRNAHVIAVIDDGKVAEQGSHSHLLKNYPDGCYAKMIQLQRFSHGEAVNMASASSSKHG
ncbi:putative ABC-type xenobiotic transporter [Helianthus annuus]|uniref:ABC-type xenobiotic transporter n=1 Tax=Helianthus annuus TaxID=4232 RepID=A0A251SKV3_HELAN|nr:ABC transporter B family member 1 [Helianthus annuus]KAF5770404.1 putative ABC-type xenobiotic transporter [Helianthus annuus]KAJ0486915.1 putative ABC-type xenobiotic transporter [Helianthus annuus]KAJ0661041.1 putative ABC-type xenobiotic transporter [Helianthus annuus]KAJ0841586.1 putative ABC-type xenobiotic transporter [Helianthus annuus]KAJ0855132.1 putative ABC-type xenobiotic transporter [Helianthus annuus]